MDGTAITDFINWTSTTTAQTNFLVATLIDDNCAPGDVCRYAVSGLVYGDCAAGITANHSITTGSNRCEAASQDQMAQSSHGRVITAAAGGKCWYMLGLY